MIAEGTRVTFDAENPTDRDEVARLLEAHGSHKVLRRFEPPGVYYDAPIPEEHRKLAAIVDAETTGLDDTDKIIEFSILLFEFDIHTGRIHRVVDSYSGFEDPGFPIPAEITALTGIRTEDVLGQRVDEEAVKRIADQAGLIIAFKADFDRPFAERRFPWFRDTHWGCALSEVDWDLFGARGKKQLDYMIERVLGLYCDGHRALEDCEVTLHLLATPRVPVETVDVTPFMLLLQSVQTPTVRVFAINSPFDSKDVLKKHGYHWSDGKNGKRKAWWKDVAKEALEAEQAFLANEVYGPWGYTPAPYITKITSRDRYSNRA